MVNLLALLDDDALVQRVNGQNSLRVGDLLAVDEDAALLDKLAGFTVGAAQTRGDHGGQQADTTVLDKLGVQLRAGHILVVGGTAEQAAGSGLRLFGLLLTVDHLRQLVGQNLLGLVQLLTLPVVHLVDLLQRQEGQHTDALEHIRVADVAPVLVELERARLVGVKPDGVARGLAHLLALGVGQQRDRHGVGILAQLAADQLGAAQHVAPLVVPAELHVAAIVLEHVVEVVALHDHVVELQEAEAFFEALLIALGAEHVVDGEACADLAQELDVIEL